MAMEKWSDEIVVLELSDDPQFGEDMTNLLAELEQTPYDVVLNFSGVSFLNSSGIAKLLRLRKRMLSLDRWLMLCGINTKIKNIFSVTGLDKIFQFAGDVSTALATVQLFHDEDK